MLDDGTSGLMVVRAHGGAAIIQNPQTAMFPPMPQSALRRVPDAEVLDLQQIPAALETLVNETVEATHYGDLERDDPAARESRIADVNMSEIEKEDKLGNASEFACPECGGVLWEIEQGDLLRFRCRVGHAYTADHLQAAQRHAVETALWAALRALEESLSMYRRLATRAKTANNRFTAQMYQDRIVSTEANTRVLQEFLLNVNGHGEEGVADAEESA
jgi:two-component system chemotaxis response regulator CheB